MQRRISRILFVFSCLVVFLFNSAFESGSGGTKFVEGKWGMATKLASQVDKPIMVFVGAPYCQFSQRMTDVFDQKEVGIFFNTRFVCKRLDTDNPVHNFRASNWGVSSVPTFLFISKGEIIYRVSGYRNGRDIVAEAKKALKKIEDENRKRLR